MKVKDFFVLGGNDAEMERIREHLDTREIPWIQPVKGWGAKEFGPAQIGGAGMGLRLLSQALACGKSSPQPTLKLRRAGYLIFILVPEEGKKEKL